MLRGNPFIILKNEITKTLTLKFFCQSYDYRLFIQRGDLLLALECQNAVTHGFIFRPSPPSRPDCRQTKCIMISDSGTCSFTFSNYLSHFYLPILKYEWENVQVRKSSALNLAHPSFLQFSSFASFFFQILKNLRRFYVSFYFLSLAFREYRRF